MASPASPGSSQSDEVDRRVALSKAAEGGRRRLSSVVEGGRRKSKEVEGGRGRSTAVDGVRRRLSSASEGRRRRSKATLGLSSRLAALPSSLSLSLFRSPHSCSSSLHLRSSSFISLAHVLLPPSPTQVDIVITTALIPGKKAPTLVDADMVCQSSADARARARARFHRRSLATAPERAPLVIRSLPRPSPAFHGFPWPSTAFHSLPQPSTAPERAPCSSASHAGLEAQAGLRVRRPRRIGRRQRRRHRRRSEGRHGERCHPHRVCAASRPHSTTIFHSLPSTASPCTASLAQPPLHSFPQCPCTATPSTAERAVAEQVHRPQLAPGLDVVVALRQQPDQVDPLCRTDDDEDQGRAVPDLPDVPRAPASQPDLPPISPPDLQASCASTRKTSPCAA